MEGRTRLKQKASLCKVRQDVFEPPPPPPAREEGFVSEMATSPLLLLSIPRHALRFWMHCRPEIECFQVTRRLGVFLGASRT